MRKAADGNSLKPSEESAEQQPEAEKRILIKGLHDFKDLVHIRPEQLWNDGGIPFPRVLLVKCKKFTDACGLIRKMERE